MLTTLVILLCGAAIAVPLTRRAGFGRYSASIAGIAIGPRGWVDHQCRCDRIHRQPWRGDAAVPDRTRGPATTALGDATCCLRAGHSTGGDLRRGNRRLGILGWRVMARCDRVGAGLAMSSTAIVLPLLGERDLLRGRAGRDAFAVLLFQDLAFIPLVALLPLLANNTIPDQVPWHDVARAIGAIVVILIGGRFLLPPLFRAVGGTKTPELFTTVALLIVTGAALLASVAGLSPSLGAFMAGVLLSKSEYRHELQADIEPFEGLLLGFFFISVGMSADLPLAGTQPGLLALATVTLLAAKAIICFVLARVSGEDTPNALRFSLALPQASEFSFVLFGAAVSAGVLTAGNAAFATLVTAASMIATPVLFAANEAGLRRRPQPAPQYDTIEADGSPVIVCGFGRFGQIIGRVLRMSGIRFTALERDPGQVDVLRRFGTKVYFGDPTRPDVLRAAGVEQAKLIIIAMDDPPAVLRCVDMVKHNFPKVAILARARNRWYSHLLMDRAVEGFVRETFYSSLELAKQALVVLGTEIRRRSAPLRCFATMMRRTWWSPIRFIATSSR